MNNITISSLLNEKTEKTPDKIVIVVNGVEISWLHLKRLTDIAACDFLKLGITKHSHVGIFSVNSLQWIVSYLALAKIRALPVLINYNYKKAELEEVISYADIEYLLYGDAFRDNDFGNLVSNLNYDDLACFKTSYKIGKNCLKKWNSLFDSEIDLRELKYLESQVKTDDDLNLIFTSGTTTKTKGIILSHYQMLNISRIQAEKLHWDESDIVCLPLPLFHCFGLSCGIFAALNVNVKLCLTSTRSKPILETIEKYKCSVLNGVPSMFNTLINNKNFDNYDLKSLNSGIIAGSRVDKVDFIIISEKCHLPHLQQSYGQTESSPSITFSDYNDSLENRSKSVGKVIPEIEVRIFDNCDDKVLNCNQTGEIQVKGFNVIKNGYYKLVEESLKLYSKDGWMRTGDTGYFDEDNNLYVNGRIKEMSIKRGENICPYEIEEVFMMYQDIKQVKVLGILDKLAGEEILAVYNCFSECDEDKLVTFLKSKLADYKVPKYFLKIKEFPLNENGKINKDEIKKLISSKFSGGEADGIKSTTNAN